MAKTGYKRSIGYKFIETCENPDVSLWEISGFFGFEEERRTRFYSREPGAERRDGNAGEY